MPLGTRLHVVESRRLSDGAQRVRVAIVGEEDLLGWLTAKKPSTDTVTIRELKEDEFGSLGMEKWAAMDAGSGADAAVDVGDGEVEATGGFTPRYVRALSPIGRVATLCGRTVELDRLTSCRWHLSSIATICRTETI